MRAQFLDGQEQRRSATSVARYRAVVELLLHDLNGYAYLSLAELDARLFQRLRNAAADTPPELGEIVGPEHILPNVVEFLGSLMARKVIARRLSRTVWRPGSPAG